MHLLEELELALQRGQRRAVADETDQLRRRPPPPEPARQRPEADRRDRGDEEQLQIDGPHSTRPTGVSESSSTTGRRRHRDPGEDRRDLVGGEVPERPVVAVVEAEELGEQRPERQEEEAPRRCRWPGTVDDQRRERRRAEVGEGELAAAVGRRATSARGGTGIDPARGATDGATARGLRRSLGDGLTAGELRHLCPSPCAPYA